MDFAAARRNMVENQIRTNRVADPRVIAALAGVPREAFLPKAMRNVAYVDDAVEVAPGRAMMAPLALARLLQGAAIKPGDVVLVIGDAAGYVSAIAAKLANTAVSVEGDAELASRSGAVLGELGIDNAAVVQGQLDKGLPNQAPYDVIVFAGAVGDIPAAICRQLADGGRLVAIVDAGAGVGKGTLVVRVGDTYGRRVLFDGTAPALPGFEAKPAFVL